MKKILFCATLAVALVLSGCSNGVNKLPEDLREIIEEADKELQENSKDSKEDGVEYKGVKVKDHDIIFTIRIEEKALEGHSLKEAIKYIGMDSKSLKRQVRSGKMFGDTKDSKKLAKLLCDYEYNIVFRFESGKDVEESRVDCKDLPEYKDRNRSNLK